MNALGFGVGTLIAGDGAPLRNSLPKLAAEVIYGVCIGLGQALGMLGFARRPNARLWIPLTAIGFVVGGIIGSRVAFSLAADSPLLATVFGVGMGGCVGLSQYPAWRQLGHGASAVVYTIISWVLLENLAFVTNVNPYTAGLWGIAGAAGKLPLVMCGNRATKTPTVKLL